MNWEKKVALCNAINNDDTEALRKVVLDNIESFDAQSWDMFAEAELGNDIESVEFYKKVLPYLHNVSTEIFCQIGFRGKMRLSLIEHIISEHVTE